MRLYLGSGLLIAVDLDGVVINLADPLVRFHNKTYGTKLTAKDLTHYDLYRAFGCTKEEEMRRINEFYDSKYFMEAEPYPEVVETVGRLKEDGNNMISVTSRPERISSLTRVQVRKHAPDMFSNIYYTGDKFHDKGSHFGSKAVACKALKVDVLFEDSVEFAIECAKIIPAVYLIDRPWNRYLPPKVEKLPENVHVLKL